MLSQILGISRDAGDMEIKRAYRGLAKQLHPDKASICIA
jgi:curved DNA-binding protein CbpA